MAYLRKIIIIILVLNFNILNAIKILSPSNYDIILCEKHIWKIIKKPKMIIPKIYNFRHLKLKKFSKHADFLSKNFNGKLLKFIKK